MSRQKSPSVVRDAERLLGSCVPFICGNLQKCTPNSPNSSVPVPFPCPLVRSCPPKHAICPLRCDRDAFSSAVERLLSNVARLQMASDNEASCESDPNFAVICAFMEKFGATCGLASVDFLELQEMLENTQEVPQELIDLHIKLLRKSRKTVSNERWEKAVIKFCHSFCVQDAWEIERFGYKKARLSSKLRVLKELLEMQFDYNVRFKSEINKMSAEELRSQPLGKDKQGHAYWFQNDNNCQIRVYKEDPDEETWTLVAKDRDGLVALIDELSNGDADSKAIAESVLNEEDSNSLAEKPIIDTGQVVDTTSSSSDSNNKKMDESDNSNESKKESLEDEEEEIVDKKRPRDTISDPDSDLETKKPRVGEAIEEPVMLVKGLGNGVENQCDNPIVSEEVEEEVMYIYGSGDGAACQTGNEDEKKEESGGSSSSGGGVSISVKNDPKNCIVDEVPAPVKSPFKLGTIIDTKTDNKIFNASKSPTKKASRWDVETIIAKEPPPSLPVEEEMMPPPKKSMFFFGPGCLQFKASPVACSAAATVAFGQKVPHTDGDSVEETVLGEGVGGKIEKLTSKVTGDDDDVGYRIDSVEISDCVQSKIGPSSGDDEISHGIDTLLVDQQTPSPLSSKIDRLADIGDRNEETKAIKRQPDIPMEVEPQEGLQLVEGSEETEEEIVKQEHPDENSIKEETVKQEGTLKTEEETVKHEKIVKIETVKPEKPVKEETIKLEETVKEETVKQEDTVKEETVKQEAMVKEEIVKEETATVKEEDIKQEGEAVLVASVKEEEGSKVVMEGTEMSHKEETVEVPSPQQAEDTDVSTELTQCPQEDVKTKEISVEILEENVEIDQLRNREEVRMDKVPIESTQLAEEEPPIQLIKNTDEQPVEEVPVMPTIDIEEQQTEEPTTNTEELPILGIPVEPTTTQDDSKHMEEQGTEIALLEPTKEEVAVTEQPSSEESLETQPQSTKPEEKELVMVEVDEEMEKVASVDDMETKGSEEVAEGITESVESTVNSAKDVSVEGSEKEEEGLQIAEEITESVNSTIDVPAETGDKEEMAVLVDETGVNKEVEILAQGTPINKETEVITEKAINEETATTTVNMSESKQMEEVSVENKEDIEQVPSDLMEITTEQKEAPVLLTNSTHEVETETQSESTINIEEKIKEVPCELTNSTSESEKEEITAHNTVEQNIEDTSTILTIDKNENISAKEADRQMEKPQKEPEVTTTLSELEKEIVPDGEVCEVKIDDKIPEVTVALVESEQKVTPSSLEEDELKPTNLTMAKKEEREPVIEEECIKKHSYLLGDDEETETKEDVDGPVEKTQLEPVLVESKKLEEVCSQLQEREPEEPLTNVDEVIKDNQQQEKLNCSVAAENQETVISGSVLKMDKDSSSDVQEEKPPILEEVMNKEEPEPVVVLVKEPMNNNKRGRKNNISGQPKMVTRRSTRSSRNEESKLAEEATDLSVKEPPPSPKVEDSTPQTLQQQPPRRGRSRGIAKVEKAEVPEVDNTTSKKMKMSEEVVEADKPPKQTRNRLKENQEPEEEEEPPKLEPCPEVVTVESGNSSDGIDAQDHHDPLAVSEGEEENTTSPKDKAAPMSLASFSLDFHESPAPTPPLTRSGLRKRGRESPPNTEEAEGTAGKRLKKGKRNIDTKLRKSIEEQKKQELISSDDDKHQQQQQLNQQTPEGEKITKKKGKKHRKQTKNEVVESDAETAKETEQPAQKKTKTVNRNKRLLTNLGINPDLLLTDFQPEAAVGVRQSRRIAQLKIKEEAERRKLEEEMAQEQEEKKKKKSKKSEDKDYKVKKSKNEAANAAAAGEDDDVQEEDSTDSKKRKRKKKKHKMSFDELNPWRSSSDSSTTDDEEDEDEIVEEEDDEELHYVSDHEFSPESDLEADGEAQPLKRARTARKESDVEEVDDCPCQKCGKADHPEWILLCDRCDNGWHCSCLRPPLLVIPEGDWFCPPCQHGTLLKRLQEKLKDYDKKLSKKEIEDRRKQRLAYVGISLNNVLPTKEMEVVKNRRMKIKYDVYEDDDSEDEDADEEEDDDEDDDEENEESGSGSGSQSGSDSDEPIYQLRQRRQSHSYRFNDYDDLINSAIQDEMEAVKGAGNQGRGKDIATIVNAEKEEEWKKETENGTEAAVPVETKAALTTVVPTETELVEEPLPPVVPPDDRDKEAKPLYSDDEPVLGVKKKIVGRKKHRKLNSLDISSADDDEDSDEDFKGTSSESDDDFDEDLGSEDSEDLDSGRGRRRNADPVRRSTRARTSRYDADFIDDGDSEDEDEAPRRKKKRSIWDESESEESDRSWGRRKRKPAANRKKTTTSTASLTAANKKKSKKKKKKKNDDSDAEVYRKKKPKIKFGLDGEDEGPGRRTRGKKINYVDALGSDDSDEDRVKRPPPRIESEEEYVANEEDELDEDDKVTDEEDSGEDKSTLPPKIQSYADARFTQLLPEGVPTPKELYINNQTTEDGEDEPNPIDQINRNVEMMDENEMEKMMEEEEYANKQLQMVAMQLEKEKRRKEREAKKLEGLMGQPVPLLQQQQQLDAKKRAALLRKPPTTMKSPFQFSGPMQEPIVGNVDSLIVNAENNDELSEPPGVSLPMFADLGGPGGTDQEDPAKKRRARSKKSLEEAVANLGSVRQQQESTAGFLTMATNNPTTITTNTNNNKNLPTDLSSGQDSNIEIAAPPQPFSQSQPTPSVITRMLQSKPGQPGYPVGTIRPKQFASMSERGEEEGPGGGGGPPPPPNTHHSMSPAPPAHHPQYMQGAPLRPQLGSPYRQLPPAMNHYARVAGAPPPGPHQIRNPPPPSLPSHLYHTHRPMDPSPSGGGAISIADHHNSPGRVVSPSISSPGGGGSGGGGGKNDTPPPPYTRPPPPPPPSSVGRFPMINTTSGGGGPTRHMSMVAPPQHLQPPPRGAATANLSPYHPSMPPSYHYGQFGGQSIGGTEDALPPTVYQNSPYSEQFSNEGAGHVNPSENSNSKSFDDESGGEFGGLVSYFSSQREDDLES